MGILYAHDIKINDAISVRIPTVGEVVDDEENFNAVISMIISTPYDMMVQLDDAGIDFTTLNSYELFLMMFDGLKKADTRLVFGPLDLSKFNIAKNTQSNEVVLYNQETGAVIDRPIHEQISNTLRRILQVKKTEKKPGNEEGKKYMIRVARLRQKRQKRLAREKNTSQLEDMIVSVVNTSEFPYDYESVRNITIYQFYTSLNQLQHKIQFDKMMIGLYAGTVKYDELKPEDKTWIKI